MNIDLLVEAIPHTGYLVYDRHQQNQTVSGFLLL